MQNKNRQITIREHMETKSYLEKEKNQGIQLIPLPLCITGFGLFEQVMFFCVVPSLVFK